MMGYQNSFWRRAMVLLSICALMLCTLEQGIMAAVTTDTKVILVGQAFNDASYLVENTAAAQPFYRDCNGRQILVYRFDLTEAEAPSIYLNVSQNYLVEVSSDGESYTQVANYIEQNGGTPYIYHSSKDNRALVRVDSELISFDAPVYIRLSNANAPGGFGTRLSAIYLRDDAGYKSDGLMGDVNDDDRVDASDALLCLQHSVQLIVLKTNFFDLGDVSNDHRIDASDALLILQKSVQLIDRFPAESVLADWILKSGNRLVFLGDSITDGGRDYSDPSSLGMGYVRRIQCLLQGMYPDREFTFINRGMSGWRSEQVIDNIQADCVDQQPDVVTVMIGINDTGSGMLDNIPIHPATYEYNMLCILDEIIQTGAIPIVLSPYALPHDRTEGWHEADLNEKINIAQRVAKNKGAIFIPLDEILNSWEHEEYRNMLSPDGVHPYESAINLIAIEWLKAIENA